MSGQASYGSLAGQAAVQAHVVTVDVFGVVTHLKRVIMCVSQAGLIVERGGIWYVLFVTY